MNMVERLRKIGWLAVEAAFLLIVICILLNVILGNDGGGVFIASVSANAMRFLQAIPPGIFIGLVLIVAFFGFVRSRLPK
jgi:hypothetical protein